MGHSGLTHVKRWDRAENKPRTSLRAGGDHRVGEGCPVLKGLETAGKREGNAWGDLGGKDFGWGERFGVLPLHPPPLPFSSSHLPGD